MMTIKEIKQTLIETLNKLNENNKYEYYGIYYIREKDNGKIEAAAYRFPTFEELVFEDKEKEEQIFINGNFIHILDMRVFLINNPYTGGLSTLNRNYPLVENTKEGLMKLFTAALKTGQRREIDIYEAFTKAERAALKDIYDAIGLEGEVSISKLVKLGNASRITFNNLLNTLYTNDYAEVMSRGVKGTKIKITDPTLISHLSQLDEI